MRLAQLLLQKKLLTSEQVLIVLKPAENGRSGANRKTTSLRPAVDLAEVMGGTVTPSSSLAPPTSASPPASAAPSPGVSPQRAPSQAPPAPPSATVAARKTTGRFPIPTGQIPATPTPLPTPLPPLPPPLVGGAGDPVVGEQLAEYLLVREVARGGMGVLFEAERLGTSYQRFALKVLSARAASSQQLLARFRLEAQLASHLDHPNVVKVHEVGHDRGRHYLVMDFFDGRSMAELLKEGRLLPRKAVEVLATVARAADYMHERNVLHRDLKPANILVGKKGNVCVTDFGLAKDLARTDATLTRIGVALGTPAYMAPEQARGELDKVGPWSDVYSLGATLYRSLAGTYPHDADSMVAAVQKIAREEPVPLEKRRPDVPGELARIVGRAMARDPGERPRARELGDQLERFLETGPVVMPPAPPNPRV